MVRGSPLSRPRKKEKDTAMVYVFSRDEFDMLHKTMIATVERCYKAHGCEYLLQFCDELAQCVKFGYRFQDNFDGTTSMFDKRMGKLLVTFRNENRDYDKFHWGAASPRRPRLSSHRSNSTAMTQRPDHEVYVCKICSSEFASVKDLRDHEGGCTVEESPPCSPEPPDEDYDSVDQVQFLSYVGLSPDPQSKLKLLSYQSPRRIHKCGSVKKHHGVTIHRLSAIAFSSPLGINVMKLSKLGVNTYSQINIDRYERFVEAVPRAKSNKISRSRTAPEEKWLVTYRAPKKDYWTHSYTFNKADLAEKKIIWRTGLTKRSRELKKQVRGLSVKLKRLEPHVIAEWTGPKPKRPTPQLRPLFHQAFPLSKNVAHIQNGSFYNTHSLQPPTVQQQQPEHILGLDIDWGVPVSTGRVIEVVDLCSSDEETEQRTDSVFKLGNMIIEKIANVKSEDCVTITPVTQSKNLQCHWSPERLGGRSRNNGTNGCKDKGHSLFSAASRFWSTFTYIFGLKSKVKESCVLNSLPVNRTPTPKRSVSESCNTAIKPTNRKRRYSSGYNYESDDDEEISFNPKYRRIRKSLSASPILSTQLMIRKQPKYHPGPASTRASRVLKYNHWRPKPLTVKLYDIAKDISSGFPLVTVGEEKNKQNNRPKLLDDINSNNLMDNTDKNVLLNQSVKCLFQDECKVLRDSGYLQLLSSTSQGKCTRSGRIFQSNVDRPRINKPNTTQSYSSGKVEETADESTKIGKNKFISRELHLLQMDECKELKNMGNNMNRQRRNGSLLHRQNSENLPRRLWSGNSNQGAREDAINGDKEASMTQQQLHKSLLGESMCCVNYQLPSVGS